MKKYGFVYLWYDRFRKMYYVGCHWGKETDGYICSSNIMRDAYRRRPEDFKRRIIKTNIETKQKLFEEELRYLKMIKDCEIRPNCKKPRYYNLNNKNNTMWHTFDEKVKTIGQKISKANKGRHHSPATEFKKGECISPETQFKRGLIPHNKNKSLEEKYGIEKATIIREKQRKAKLGKSNNSSSKFTKNQTPWNLGLKYKTSKPKKEIVKIIKEKQIKCFFLTPWGKYPSIDEAIKNCPFKMTKTKLYDICKYRNEDTIKRNTNPNFPVGYKYKELGYGYEENI